MSKFTAYTTSKTRFVVVAVTSTRN